MDAIKDFGGEMWRQARILVEKGGDEQVSLGGVVERKGGENGKWRRRGRNLVNIQHPIELYSYIFFPFYTIE